jgi:tetratricopeptide (TPR) repeat protein
MSDSRLSQAAEPSMIAPNQPPTGEIRAARSTKGRTWLLALLLLAATVIAYEPAWDAGFIWDDDDYVIKNKLLTAPDGLKRIWFSLDSPSQYFPLTYTTFRIERGLWGLNPTGYHWVNILLHAANALLLWRLLRRLNIPGAWLAAAIFALHPVQVESVAWVTERKNVLSLFFSLLTMRAWLAFVDARGGRSWFYYGLSLFCFALALSGKTTACTLPAAMLLVLWLRDGAMPWRRLAQVAPYLAMGAGIGLVTMWWERFHQGTQGELFSIGLIDRILIASRGIWFYLGKLIWPANLTFSYPRWVIHPSDPLSYVWLAALGLLAGAIWRARRLTGRGPEVAALFFVVTLLPTSGLIMLWTFVWSFVADHYQYVACIGPLTLAAAALTLAAARIKGRLRLLVPVLGGALLLVLGVLTWQQCTTYRDLDTLWRTTIARNPDSWLARYNLGIMLSETGHVPEATAQFQKAVELRPDYVMAHYNLGALLLYSGHLEEAIARLKKALTLDPRHPLVHRKLGDALMREGKVDEAIAHYQTALAVYTNFADARRNLAYAFLQRGRADEAIAQYQRALELEPGNLGALDNLGNAFLQKGRYREAAACFEKVLLAQPHYVLAENNLAWVLATAPDPSVRNGNKAVELALDVDKLSGGQNPIMIATLAAAYAEAGRFPEAVATIRRAMELATAQNNAAQITTFQMELGMYQAGTPLHAGVPASSGQQQKP